MAAREQYRGERGEDGGGEEQKREVGINIVTAAKQGRSAEGQEGEQPPSKAHRHHSNKGHPWTPDRGGDLNLGQSQEAEGHAQQATEQAAAG